MELKQLRETLGLSQKQVATLTQVSISTIRNLEQKGVGSESMKQGVAEDLDHYQRFSGTYGNDHDANIEFILMARQLELSDKDIKIYIETVESLLLNAFEAYKDSRILVEQFMKIQNLTAGLPIWLKSVPVGVAERFLVYMTKEGATPKVAVFRNESSAVKFARQKRAEQEVVVQVVHVMKNSKCYSEERLQEVPFKWERWSKGFSVSIEDRKDA